MLTDLSKSHPVGVYAEGGQPNRMDSMHICASLRRAARMLADPSTPSGAVADELLEQGARLQPGLTGSVQTSPLVREQ